MVRHAIRPAICLFTGDSLSWSFVDNDLNAFRDFCWYSWEEQTRSLARLLDYDFEWVLAGHGGSHGLPAPEMQWDWTEGAALFSRGHGPTEAIWQWEESVDDRSKSPNGKSGKPSRK